MNNSIDNIAKEKKLLLLKDNNILKVERENVLEFLSFYETILTSKKRIEVFKVFLIHGATTARELAKMKTGSYGYIYRLLDGLMDAGLIRPIHKIKTSNKLGGAPTTVYGLIEVSDQEVRKAVSRYLKSCSRIYRIVEMLYQRTLYDVKDEEINFQKICAIAKNQGRMQRFHWMDVAQEIELRLKEEGIKVWR